MRAAHYSWKKKYTRNSLPIYIYFSRWIISRLKRGRRGRYRMVVGLTITYAISAYHHWCCEFESHSGDTTLCNKVCQWLTTGQWFSPGTQVSSTNKTDRHDITEILLKVASNTINLKPPSLKLSPRRVPRTSSF